MNYFFLFIGGEPKEESRETNAQVWQNWVQKLVAQGICKYSHSFTQTGLLVVGSQVGVGQYQPSEQGGSRYGDRSRFSRKSYRHCQTGSAC